GEELLNADLTTLHHFALKVNSHMTRDTFDSLQDTFPEVEIKSLKATQAQHAHTLHRAAFLAVYKPVAIDCCVNSCCAFTGAFTKLKKCHYSDQPRYDSGGQPRKQFTYSPIIPRLQTLARNRHYADLMQYRTKHDADADPNKFDDVFDGSEYQRLKAGYVSTNGKCAHKNFEDPQDIALGISTDGFAPFHHHKQT
ncbi:hypothetical protein FIBSPDRAFT_663054, partial [Athelia psychrophila]